MLYEKFVEQELEEVDQLSLNAMKYLGQHVFWVRTIILGVHAACVVHV
jgi:hypothetical protein